jgi:subtilisin family serine protease
MFVAIAIDALAHVGMNSASGGGGYFITVAQAKKGGGQGKPEGSRNDNGEGQGQRDGNNNPDNSNPGNDGKPNSDDHPANETRDAESTQQRAGRDPGSSSRQGEDAEPPPTVAEALKRFFKWVQPEPRAIPPWPEAKVTRAPPEERAPTRAREQVAQRTGKGSSRRVSSGNVPPRPGTYRPDELLIVEASPAALRALHDRGWHEVPSAANGVVRLVSRAENALVDRDRLEAEFPGTRIGLNLLYSLAGDSVPVRSSEVVASTQSCTPERCYGPALIRWREDLAACATGVKIGVIDTAVDEGHPALAWRALKVHQPPRHRTTDAPLESHGTSVVSLLAGRPKSGTPGLVPAAEFVIANAFFKNVLGQAETDTEHFLWALKLLEEQEAQVVNMSVAGPRDELIYRRLVELSQRGMIFVAAAGNGGPQGPAAYPAAYKNEVIAVTAVDRKQRVYDHANRGDYIDVAAPGVQIWTALVNNREGAVSGTSFAAPFVTATIAVIYKQTLLPEMGATSAHVPEADILAHLPTANTTRNEKVGLGLVSAPSKCAMGDQRQVPSAELVPSIGMTRWSARVHQVSSQSAN